MFRFRSISVINKLLSLRFQIQCQLFENRGAIHSTKISENFGPKLNGSVRSNRKSFEKTGPPFGVVFFSRSDRSEFWLNGSRPRFQGLYLSRLHIRLNRKSQPKIGTRVETFSFYMLASFIQVYNQFSSKERRSTVQISINSRAATVAIASAVSSS